MARGIPKRCPKGSRKTCIKKKRRGGRRYKRGKK